MRTAMIAVLALGGVAASGAVAEAARVVVEAQIKNMACPVCARAVGERIRALAGVQDVKISLKTDTARIVMAAGRKPDLEAIKQAIAEAGFEPGTVAVVSRDEGSR